jgi:hypothetical protein
LRISGARSGAESSNLRMGPRIASDARPLKGGLAALGLACLSAFSATQADGEVVVDGGRDEMQVRVENDTVGHVLEALGQNVSLHYRSAAPLNKVIGGSFSGSLAQVLSRVLAGYDFVVRYNMQGVEIFVVGESGAAPTPLRPIEASPRPQTASTVADQDAPSISLAPRFARAKRQASMTCGPRREFQAGSAR